jgi:ribosomal protein S18 acetylase RimI-like enzyme
MEPSMIRPTNTDDVPRLVELTAATGYFRDIEIKALREVFDDYFKEEEAAGHRCMTFDGDGELLGFTYYAPASMTDRTWHLWWIVVSAQLHGKGVGSQLLRYVEEDLARRAARVLFIETSSQPRYEPTRRFYLKHGYEQHAVLHDFYAAGDDLVVFRKVFGEKLGFRELP